MRSVADIQRFFPYNAQNAIIAKGSADQVALAEKILHDLDKPKSEVVVDIIVMEASSVYSRQLTAAIASTGLNMPVQLSRPRAGITSRHRCHHDTTTGTDVQRQPGHDHRHHDAAPAPTIRSPCPIWAGCPPPIFPPPSRAPCSRPSSATPTPRCCNRRNCAPWTT